MNNYLEHAIQILGYWNSFVPYLPFSSSFFALETSSGYGCTYSIWTILDLATIEGGKVGYCILYSYYALNSLQFKCFICFYE